MDHGVSGPNSAMSAERNMPRTAIGAVHQLLFALRELRQGMGHTNVSEEVHALSLRSATYLGLYSLEHASLNHAHRLSQEYVSDVFDALHSASKRWKEHLNSTVTVNKNTSTPAQIRELATQASELSFATQGLREASSSAVYIPPPIPPKLWTGALSRASEPSTDHRLAVETLHTLCQVIIPTASDMHLECFQERIDMQDTNSSLDKIHTLTCGGRIIVLDIELDLASQTSSSWIPHVSLQLSFASANGAQSPTSKDSGLAEVVRLPLQQLARIMFGLPVDHQILQRFCKGARLDSSYAQTAALWHSFTSTLASLACIDGLHAFSPYGDTLDAFHVLEQLGSAALHVCSVEADELAQLHAQSVDPARPLHDQPSITRLLHRYGHGLALHHYHTPYLCIAFTPVHSATVRIAPSAVPFAPDAKPACTLVSSARMPQMLYEPFHARNADYDQARPLAFIAHIKPALLVPHRVARHVYLALGLARHHLSTSKPRRPVHGYVAQLVRTSHRFCASLRDEECRSITSLPFQSLAHLYAALEILQEHAHWAALLASAQEDPSGESGLVTTLQLESDTEPSSSRLRLSTLVSEQDMVINAQLRHRKGWQLQAQAVSLKQRISTNLPDDKAHTFAESLNMCAQLGGLVNDLLAWTRTLQ